MSIMKLATSFFVAMLLTFIAPAVNAQMGNWHDSQELCEEVYKGGDALEYKPAPNATRAQQRANVPGVTRQPLPQDVCLKMLVADNRYHSIFLPQGTEMLWKDGRPYAHPVCGNSTVGEPLWLTHQAVYRSEVAVAGRDGRDGAQGPRGERGPPGPPPPPSSGFFSDYGVGDMVDDGFKFYATHELGEAIADWQDAKTERERIKAWARVEQARYNSQRGPQELTVIQQGNCNAAFGSRTSCVTQSAPGPAGPPGRDGQPGRPGTPVFDPGPGVSPPIIRPTEPGVSPPIFGGGTEPGVRGPIFRDGGGLEPGVGPGTGTEPGVGRPIFGDGGNPLPPPVQIEPGN